MDDPNLGMDSSRTGHHRLHEWVAQGSLGRRVSTVQHSHGKYRGLAPRGPYPHLVYEIATPIHGTCACQWPLDELQGLGGHRWVHVFLFLASPLGLARDQNGRTRSLGLYEALRL